MTRSSRPVGGAIAEDRQVRAMFGRIVRHYDLMNRLMTGGRDVAWRRLAVRLALSGRPAGAYALDVATGTGDLALTLAAGGARFVVGLDFAAPMIHAAARKSLALGPPTAARATDEGTASVAWIVGDALALPFPDKTFDACTVAFGLRNMADYAAALREMARTLRPDGTFVCLELTPYHKPVLGPLFNFYFTRLVPLVGGLLSGDDHAYRYLPRSVATFPPADELARLMRAAGLIDVSYRLLGGGTVALHVGTKPPG